jgi:hypothetical protein
MAVVWGQYTPASGLLGTLQYRAPLLITDFTEIRHFLLSETYHTTSMLCIHFTYFMLRTKKKTLTGSSSGSSNTDRLVWTWVAKAFVSLCSASIQDSCCTAFQKFVIFHYYL